MRGRLRPPFHRRGHTIGALGSLRGGGFPSPTPLLSPRREDCRGLFRPRRIDGEHITMMLRIACTCGHAGLVSAMTLPRDLTCLRCGCSRRVEVKNCARIRNPVAIMERILGDLGRSTRQAAADLNSGRDGGRPLPVENLDALAVHQGGSPSARESISGRIALRARQAARRRLGMLFSDRRSRGPLELW